MFVTRRSFFRAISAAAMAGAGGAADRPKQNMVMRSARPYDAEMALDGFDTWITPIERFFVRTHVYEPAVDVAAWRLKVGGEVSKPLTLTLDDLKKMPAVETVGVLECAGNGRSFYRPTVPGLQWEHGGVGNGRWKGVRLGDILRQAGVKPSGKNVLLDGADVPIGTMPDFQRTLPVNKALAPETLLAYEMNGEPLPVAHGFPLRVVAPGWAGDSWVKWLTNIQVIDKDFDGFFMKTAYRYPNRTVAPGTPVDAADMSPVEELRPKTVIAGPAEGARIADGSVRIHGVAWSGEAPVAKVEVSTDSGRTWRLATLGRDRAQFAWRMWETTWTPSNPGSYLVMARATDSAGRTQPFAQDWNPSGYLWNVVARRRVEVGPGPEPAAPPKDALDFPANVKSTCLTCHEGDVIAGQKLTRGQWEREVDKMVRWGASVKPEDRPALIDFLASHFGIR